MTLIGLISDVHALSAPVAEALSLFKEAGVDQVICAGDVAGYHNELERTIDLVIESGCETVLGNHDLLYLDRHGDEDGNKAVAYLRQLPTSIDKTTAGKRLYVVHARPPDACMSGIKLLDRNGELRPEWVAHEAKRLQGFTGDVLVVGHTHQVFAERLNSTLVVNPGSTAFNHSCALLRLPEASVQVIPLSGGPVKRTWIWGDQMIKTGD